MKCIDSINVSDTPDIQSGFADLGVVGHVPLVSFGPRFGEECACHIHTGSSAEIC